MSRDEEAMVRELGDAIGYGRVMQLAQRGWKRWAEDHRLALLAGVAVISPPPILSMWVATCIAYFDDGLVVLGPKCRTVVCLEPATARVHWPTGPSLCCERCADGWRKVGAAMGMHVLVEPLHYQRGGLDDAELRFAAMELT